MAIATNQQVQTYVNTRVRVRAEAFRALVAKGFDPYAVGPGALTGHILLRVAVIHLAFVKHMAERIHVRMRPAVVGDADQVHAVGSLQRVLPGGRHGMAERRIVVGGFRPRQVGPRQDLSVLGPFLTWGASAAQFMLAITLIWIAVVGFLMMEPFRNWPVLGIWFGK